MFRRIAGAMFLMSAALDIHASSSATLDSIRKSGELICGIDQSEAEYSMTDEHGSRVGFDHDICNAVAAAILGKAYRVIIKGFPDEDTALDSLRSHEVDIVASVSDDFTHSTATGVHLSPPVLFDWQTFLVRRSATLTKGSQLAGKKICFLAETETEQNVRSWFEQRHLNFVPFPFQEEGEMEAAFVTGNCTALAGDATRLANTRVAIQRKPHDYQLMPDILALDPLATAYRSNDAGFGNVVDWTIEVLQLAEQHGVTRQNLHRVTAGSDPEVLRLLDAPKALGKPLCLDDHWTARVIEAVGNYGEVFQRNVGQASPLDLPARLNSQRVQGSLPLRLPLK